MENLTPCSYLKTRTRLMMKGLCKDDTSTDLVYDMHYFLKGQKNGK